MKTAYRPTCSATALTLSPKYTDEPIGQNSKLFKFQRNTLLTHINKAFETYVYQKRVNVPYIKLATNTLRNSCLTKE